MIAFSESLIQTNLGYKIVKKINTNIKYVKNQTEKELQKTIAS